MIYVLLIILLLGIDVRKAVASKADLDKNLISYTSTNLMKGIAAVLVLFHHMESHVGQSDVLSRMNFPSVAVFFLISGYSLMYGYLYKPQYVKKILTQKIPTLVGWCIFTIIYTCVLFWVLGDPVSLKEVVFCFTGNRVLNWYFSSLLLKYLMFTLCVLVFGNNWKKMLVGLTGCSIIYMFVMRVISMGGSWYVSSLAFPLGAFIVTAFSESTNVDGEKRIAKFLGGRTPYTVMYFLFFVFVFAGVYMDAQSTIMKLIRLGCQIISAILFAMFMLSFCRGKFSKGVFKWCGKNSGQILLVQNVSLVVADYFKMASFDIGGGYTILTIVLTIALVIVTAPIYKKIEKIIVQINCR